MRIRGTVRCLPLWLLLCPMLALAQQDFSKVEVKTQPLRGGTYLLTGAGGNMVASTGEDGSFLVDDQYAPLNEKIVAALSKIGRMPLRFVINTHWHGDHTGGNEAFGKAGAVIVAHANVRKRMSSEQFIAAFERKVEPSPAAALPVVTFTETVSLHLNGDDVDVMHVAHAHTDGDALVRFRNANVLHMGDTWFNGGYPFIDLSSGGSIDGLIRALDRGLALSDAQTMIVPGHGPLGDRAKLQAYRDMLNAARERVAALKAAGKSKEAAIAAKPTAEWDEAFGKGFIKPDRFIGFVYDSLPAAKRRKK
jgi:glyoxylase-like metal-dependent hydrolase (beta-lactamase superfamily II)